MSDYYQDEPIEPVPNGVDGEEEPMSMSLGSIGGTLEDGEAGYLGEPDPGRGGLLSQTTILVVIVALVAAGTLFLMRATQKDLSSSAEMAAVEAKIATTLERLNNQSLLAKDDPLREGNLDNLLSYEGSSILQHDIREQQVPIEKVKKNPFALTLVDTSAQTNNGSDDSGYSERKRSKYLEEVRRLDLQSIMLGKRNIAVVGGEFYTVGDQLGSFKVMRIDKFTVYLEASGMPFQLSLKESGN